MVSMWKFMSEKNMKFEIPQEMRSIIVVIMLFVAFICATHLFFNIANDIATIKDQQTKEKFGGYPAEILQPVTLNMLPDLIDKDTKGIVFVKRGCLSASRESLEALRDKNSSDKEMYIIGGHPVKMEVKICGE